MRRLVKLSITYTDTIDYLQTQNLPKCMSRSKLSLLVVGENWVICGQLGLCGDGLLSLLASKSLRNSQASMVRVLLPSVWLRSVIILLVIAYYGPQIYTSLGIGTKALLLQGLVILHASELQAKPQYQHQWRLGASQCFNVSFQQYSTLLIFLFSLALSSSSLIE